MKDDVDDMVTSHPVFPEGVVERITHQEQRPVHGLVGVAGEQAWVGEETGDVGQTADVRVVDE